MKMTPKIKMTSKMNINLKVRTTSEDDLKTKMTTPHLDSYNPTD